MNSEVNLFVRSQRRGRAWKELRHLGLSLRAINALADEGICDLNSIRAMTERELAHYPKVGRSLLSKLRPHLAPEPSPSLRPHNRPHTCSVTFDAAGMNAIDSWAHENGTTRADAIRRLVAKGLRR